MKTIKQIADEIGVSKQAIQQRLKKEPLASTCRPLLAMVGGVWQVPPEAETLILSAFSDAATSKTDKRPATLVDKQPASIDTQLVGLLREELLLKNAQIENLNQTIRQQAKTIDNQNQTVHDLTLALNRQQALHAGTIQGQLTEKLKQEPPPITPEPKPAVAAARLAASPTGKRPQNSARPASKRKGLFNWFSNRI